MKRREMIINAGSAIAGLGFLTSMKSEDIKDEELITEVNLIREMNNDSFNWIWSILDGITEEELDWKINKAANSARWIIGHLNWFEEWTCDAIEDTGLYHIKNQPTTSFQSDSFEDMKTRFTKAHEKYNGLIKDLSAEQIRRPSRYLYNDHDKKRADVDLRTILKIHCTHFYGHLYQLRMIRGTYSRLNNTDKAKFDKW